MIKVIAPGWFSTVQDAGRWGYQAYGMPVAGAMDRYAYRVANLLAGNRRGAAALELTMLGGVFQFQQACLIAIAGADMSAHLDGVRIANWSAVRVPAGGVLALGYALTGCRAYLAVKGGIDTPLVLGSRSTYIRAGVGGLGGRALRTGDVLPASRLGSAGIGPTALPGELVPSYEHEIRLKVMLGPQDDLFRAEAIRTFFESSYTVSNEADRMGFRFEGPKIPHADRVEIISDALPEGAVQVPPHGMPIVMMADRQTTGGYPKIATVIGPSLPFLAQGRPGDRVCFERSSEEEALAALRLEEQRCLDMQRFLELEECRRLFGGA